MVKKGGDSGVISKIAELVNEKKLTEISDVQDHSDRNGMRVVIELKRDANPKVVLNKLYKHTPMQIDVRREHGRAGRQRAAQLLPLREVIRNYVRHQREVIVRRSKHELRALERSRAPARGPADRARPPRRGHRADPRARATATARAPA